jgi:hypothetical protein
MMYRETGVMGQKGGTGEKAIPDKRERPDQPPSGLLNSPLII